MLFRVSFTAACTPLCICFCIDSTNTMSGKGAKGLSGKGAKGTMGDKKGDKKKPTSRSARAGLQFPVGRIHRLLKVRLQTPFESTSYSLIGYLITL